MKNRFSSAKRVKQILPFREMGLTYREIGLKLKISKQAVQFALKSQGYGKGHTTLHLYECLNCHKDFSTRYNNTPTHSSHHRFCSPECRKEYMNPKVIDKGVKLFKLSMLGDDPEFNAITHKS